MESRRRKCRFLISENDLDGGFEQSAEALKIAIIGYFKNNSRLIADDKSNYPISYLKEYFNCENVPSYLFTLCFTGYCTCGGKGAIRIKLMQTVNILFIGVWYVYSNVNLQKADRSCR